MHKEDIALGATGARSYERHWRAKKLSWSAIGKLWYLLYGAIEYMDEVTLCYPQEKFNKLRTALGFKQDSELIALVESADAFRIIRHKGTGEMMAFLTPMVPSRFVLSESQVAEEPKIASEVFFAKADAIANPNDHDKIADNLHVHKNGINMKMLLAGNVPKFHVIPYTDAYNRISKGLINAYEDQELRNYYFGDFIYQYGKRYKLEPHLAKEALRIYINCKLIDHMSRRVGIENWPAEAISKWLKNIFGAKKIDYMLTEVKQTCDEYMEEQIGAPKVPF